MGHKGIPVGLSICFWCGKDKQELLIGTRVTSDVEALPKRVIHNYEPCDECKAKMDSGVTVAEVTAIPDNCGQPEIQKGTYPTGRWVVLEERSINTVFTPDVAEEVLKKKKCFMEKESFQELFGAAMTTPEGNA